MRFGVTRKGPRHKWARPRRLVRGRLNSGTSPLYVAALRDRGEPVDAEGFEPPYHIPYTPERGRRCRSTAGVCVRFAPDDLTPPVGAACRVRYCLKWTVGPCRLAVPAVRVSYARPLPQLRSSDTADSRFRKWAVGCFACGAKQQKAEPLMVGLHQAAFTSPLGWVIRLHRSCDLRRESRHCRPSEPSFAP
jgi:hypothetical protein